MPTELLKHNDDNYITTEVEPEENLAIKYDPEAARYIRELETKLIEAQALALEYRDMYKALLKKSDQLLGEIVT